jgi:outer membrane autotransporter protein
VFGGAYGRKMWGATFLDLAVIGGNLDNTSARNIGGGLALQTATASYGGWFVDPSLSAGHRIDIDGHGFAITPAMKLRYVAAHFDGYTETGSAANLTVAGRDFQAFEERAEITFADTLTMANGSHLTGRVTGGILGQQRSTGGQINIALLGQSLLAATPDRGSIAGGYGSAGLDWQMGKLTLFAAGEATYTNDATHIYAGKGSARVSW